MPADFRVHGGRPIMEDSISTRSVLIFLSVFFGVTLGDTVHLTMVTPTPYGAGSSSPSISCFRSSPDDDVTLSFGRPFPIDLPGSTIQTSTTLPDGSTQSVSGQIVTQYLPTSNDSTGLFYCEGSSRGFTTRVYSIIHSVHRRFEPLGGLVTRTINAGEGVTLNITSVNGGEIPLWRRIRNGTVTTYDMEYRGFYTVPFPSSGVNDGDLFTTIQNALGLGDNHFSMIRVIVRGCAAGKWGPPDSAGVCDWCYNGGVCDDKTGDCICPPGFMGPNCLTACGMHRFGWECEFQCGTAGNVIQSCTGSQFGLPDPYGNSCISGYHGTHCNVVCSAGSFGAGCTQTCHCESGQCNAYTGQCSTGSCQASWSGTNCQVPDVCPVGYYGDECLNKCYCLNEAACDKTTGYCNGSNGVCATGFQCVSTITTVTPMITTASSTSSGAVTAVVAVVLVILVIVLLILVLLLVRRYRRIRGQSKDASMVELQQTLESNNDMSSLEDNPVSLPLEVIDSNGDIPEPTNGNESRPKSGTSLISMLDPSSQFAGLPLYPPPGRDLKKDPIPLKEFVKYVGQAVQGQQLGNEWASFPGLEAMCSCDVSQLPDNKTKNRYRNIPAYDHCRVILEHDEEDPDLGYISACYIKGYENDKAYIATQGPTLATSHDFWKMVWQENVRIIVNGTNLVEDGKNKCHKYWPDVGQAETLGGIFVSAVSEQVRGEYKVRKMTVSKVGDNESNPRKVTQFHYTSWPDKDVPKDVTPVLKLVKDFSEATPKNAGPYLIHCSAGVGRTGVIIATHASLQRARAEKTLDIYNLVADMRDHRISIVQTPAQYAFIHLALLEALFSTNTEVPAVSLKENPAGLMKKKKLKVEFEQLNTITPIPSRERCRNSMADANQSKNRFPITLVPESSRPFLMTSREDGTDYNYINASFVNGFKQTDVAVVTQAPLPNTVLDLWRLVYDYQIPSIVMLNALDTDDESCPQYWPDVGSQDYGPFTVTVINKAKLDGYNMKELKLEHRRQQQSHNLKHFEVTDWLLGQEVPESPSTLLRLIQTVEKIKPMEGRSTILVHCIDGLNRSGVFCVVKNSLERLREEDKVDIMQTTKILRLNRPNLLNSLDLYRFCYEAMVAYVNDPEVFKADKIPKTVYENMPLQEEEKSEENIYQNA